MSTKNKVRENTISGSFSVFLDISRLFAALSVLFSHAEDMFIPLKHHVATEPSDGAHGAVVVFFVLSGYVIALTTQVNNRGSLQYAKARLSRLCSVLYPALIITAIAEYFVHLLSPALTAEFIRGNSLPRYILSGCFLNEIWFFSSAPPINRPLWSLSYEFWYYVIFGVFFFKKQGAKSFILPLIACLIAGPKILSMMPVWLLGYFAYRIPKPVIRKKNAICLMLLTFITGLIAFTYLRPLPFPIGTRPLYFAGQFLTDWFMGICFAAGLWFFPKEGIIPVDKKIVNKIRKAADLTFPIYVLHHPLLVLWRAIFLPAVNSKIQMYLAIAGVLTASAIIGYFLDRHRKYWIQSFNWILNSLKVYYLKLYVKQHNF